VGGPHRVCAAAGRAPQVDHIRLNQSHPGIKSNKAGYIALLPAHAQAQQAASAKYSTSVLASQVADSTSLACCASAERDTRTR
jgi:hypothetical protein